AAWSCRSPATGHRRGTGLTLGIGGEVGLRGRGGGIGGGTITGGTARRDVGDGPLAQVGGGPEVLLERGTRRGLHRAVGLDERREGAGPHDRVGERVVLGIGEVGMIGAPGGGGGLDPLGGLLLLT